MDNNFIIGNNKKNFKTISQKIYCFSLMIRYKKENGQPFGHDYFIFTAKNFCKIRHSFFCFEKAMIGDEND